ncbi:MAG: transglutaminase-like domain-containing protein [Rhodoferax sp.]
MTTVPEHRGAVARRTFLAHSCATAAAVAAFPARQAAAVSSEPERRFAPQPGAWKRYAVNTRVDIAQVQGDTQLWIPLPSVEGTWQRTLHTQYQTNGRARVLHDGLYGAALLHVQFGSEPQPFVELTSEVQTQDRAHDWDRRGAAVPDLEPAQRAFWTRPTALLPTGGIVRATAREVTRGAASDLEKVQALYLWILANTFREPKVRGCGEGDIASMLESGNLGGKCADINALFVGLCRSVGVPARDVYGLRLAPSAFGYRELGGNNMQGLQGAQHCRSEVFVRGAGWVAMDPADVTKVMRQETGQWLRDPLHPLVAPVRQALFGGWEGNWMAYNMAHDLLLPQGGKERLPFLMYPVAQSGGQRLDSYAPDTFRYRISASVLA